MTPGKMLIRADASPDIGTGHVMRCLALAQAWQDAGGTASFLMAQSTPSIDARLAAEKCEIFCLPVAPGSNEDSDLTIKYASKLAAEWLVVDGYAFNAEYQEQLLSDERRLLWVDDAGECHRYVADIVLNQNLTATEDIYRDCLANTQLLLGPTFCLLRREFASWRTWQRKISNTGRNVFITLGGSTSAEAGVRVM
jgi:spore coat polysaccharide biosynthesis predicted glycosyltransferase SpsG